jgi:hypothetical protein
MAVSMLHYCLVRDLFLQGALPRGGAILELGEANWYGDADPLALILPDINKHVADETRRNALAARLSQIVEAKGPMLLFEIMKVVYELFFAPSNMQAVDFEGTPGSHRLDLNYPITLDRRFNVVINHGTAEHIFNIAQVFRTMHQYTLPGGLMIHEGPFTGWVDHGFYNMQPTLFFDLAEANGYRVLAMCVEEPLSFTVLQLESRDRVHELAEQKRLPDNSMLFTVLVKGPSDAPFQTPLQGYYRKALSESGMTAWRELR